MTQTIKVWKSGMTSVSLGTPDNPARIEWLYADEEYPGGRWTLDEAQAMEWARQGAEIANSHEDSGATDYQPAIWQEDIVDNSK